MKIFVLVIIGILNTLSSLAQENFIWEKTDSAELSKNEIYSHTKMFIAQTWNSAKAVIENDDKENGIILVKGMNVQEESFMLGQYTYRYSYIVTFKMKDNKYKITLDNVYCESTMFSGNGDIVKIQPFEGDNCPKTGTLSHPGLTRSRAIKMMKKLKTELSLIPVLYQDYIQKKSTTDSEW